MLISIGILPVTMAPTPAPTVLVAEPPTLNPSSAATIEPHTFSQLQDAISQAADTGVKLVVRLNADIAMLSQLVIESEVSLYSRTNTVLSGGGSDRLFYVGSTGRLSIENITIRNGFSGGDDESGNYGDGVASGYGYGDESGDRTGNGGAVFNDEGGMVSLNRCTLTANSALGDGGGIANYGTMTMIDCTFSANSAGDDAGAVFNEGSLSLTDCTLTANFADDDSGAIETRGDAGFNRCILTANSAGDYAGGIHNYGPMKMTDCTLTANSAGKDAGAIYNEEATMNLDNCTLTANVAADDGGAIGTWGGAVNMNRCTITANVAVNDDAGGIFVEGGAGTYAVMTLNDCTLTENSAFDNAGAIEIWGGAVIMNHCTIANNSASDTGGGFHNYGTLTLNHCTLTANSARDGGAIDNEYYIAGDDDVTIEAIATLNHCALTSNNANARGGAVLNVAGTLDLNDCTLTENTANRGGAVGSWGGDVILNRCELAANAVNGSDEGLGGHAMSNQANLHFFYCTFLGDYDDDACVVQSDGVAATLSFYYYSLFENGAVCAADEVLVYNLNGSVPVSTAMTCESADIVESCAYDCSDGTEGVSGLFCR